MARLGCVLDSRCAPHEADALAGIGQFARASYHSAVGLRCASDDAALVAADTEARVVPPGPLLPLLGALSAGAGLGLAVWARAHLGRNWSGTVTVKEHHEFVRTGPYRIVRHPIYTGLLLALIGTAAAIGNWRGPLAVACALIGFLWKIHVEEKRMRLTFSDYKHYCKQTAALIPLIY